MKKFEKHTALGVKSELDPSLQVRKQHTGHRGSRLSEELPPSMPSALQWLTGRWAIGCCSQRQVLLQSSDAFQNYLNDLGMEENLSEGMIGGGGGGGSGGGGGGGGGEAQARTLSMATNVRDACARPGAADGPAPAAPLSSTSAPMGWSASAV